MYKIGARVAAVTAAALVVAAIPVGTAQASPGVPVIGPGPSGNRWGVSCVQDALDIDIDGQFGEQTYQAVKDFQREHGLQVDGTVGLATGDALFAYNGRSMLAGCLGYVPTSQGAIDPGIYAPEMAARYGISV